MKNKLRLIPALALISVGLMGCAEETVSSDNIKTGGIAGLFEVTAKNDSSATVKATLVVGGAQSNTYVSLDNGDKLTASGGDESKSMQTGSGVGRYEASFSTGAGGTEFKVALERPNDENALNNSGILPEPFSITEVPDNTPSRATDAITLKWDNGEAGAMEIEVDGDCIFKSTFKPASGSTEYTIDADKLDSTGVKDEDKKTCDLTVTITRTNSGTVDSALDNESRFRLHQVRTATFASAP